MVHILKLLDNDPAGPSPRIKKWSGGGNHQVPTAREDDPPLVRRVRGLPRENFEFLALLCAFLTNFNPIKMINYRRLCRVTSSPYSHNLLHQTASYVNFNLCYLLAAFLLVNFVSSRFARFGGLFRHSWFAFDGTSSL